VKLVHLVGFIIKKFVTMHGHMNVKKKPLTVQSNLGLVEIHFILTFRSLTTYIYILYI